ncbi:MAG: hypothetical protein R3E50_03215 [Halioglobus sp.]
MKKYSFLLLPLLGITAQVAAQPSSQGPLDQRSINMTAFVGQTVRIVAQADSCDGSPVGFIIDNVALSGGGTVLNGSFESDLDDWTTEAGGCSIYTAAQGDPIGYEGSNSAPQPTNGSALAASSADSPGSCRLYQDVAIAGAGTLTADMGWTFTQFAPENPGCEVSLRIETTAGALLDEIVVFRPVTQTTAIPATPLWALALFTGLLGVLGWRRLAQS